MRAGRDDLNLATVRAGRHELDAALPIYAVGEGWCAPVEALLDTLGVAHGRDGERLVVTLFEPQRRYAILASRLSASPEGECLAIADAAALTESELAFDQASLTLQVSGAEPVPALAALEREESRKRRAGTAAPAAPDYPQMANPWRWASVPTIDVAMTAGWSNGRATGSTLIRGAGDLLKATALWRATYLTEGGLRLPRLSGKLSRVDPNGDMLGPLNARRIEAGDIAVPAQPLIAAGSRMRGIVISSAPEWRADIFDMVEISGPLPERWHAELSQETRLLC